MFDFVEPRVRRLVADHLGVGTEELTRDVSLADELAVDSLDLVELALALETEFGISVSEATLDDVRTYGELADAVCACQDLTCIVEVGDRLRPVFRRIEHTGPPQDPATRAAWDHFWDCIEAFESPP